MGDEIARHRAFRRARRAREFHQHRETAGHADLERQPEASRAATTRRSVEEAVTSLGQGPDGCDAACLGEGKQRLDVSAGRRAEDGAESVDAARDCRAVEVSVGVRYQTTERLRAGALEGVEHLVTRTQSRDRGNGRGEEDEEAGEKRAQGGMFCAGEISASIFVKR